MSKCLRCNRCMDACEIYKCYYIPQKKHEHIGRSSL
jgi:Fe-S-cluster-containing dehydrogenase component